jgi:hypothetical protein
MPEDLHGPVPIYQDSYTTSSVVTLRTHSYRRRKCRSVTDCKAALAWPTTTRPRRNILVKPLSDEAAVRTYVLEHSSTQTSHFEELHSMAQNNTKCLPEFKSQG